MYRIEITETAELEIQEAYNWYYERSPLGAKRWVRSLRRKIETLRRQPERCPLARESDAFEDPVRQILYGKRSGVYRVMFHIVGDTVQVIHVRHSALDEVRP